MSDVKFGLLLSEADLSAVMYCLDYTAKQISQEMKATGKVPPEKKTLLGHMARVKRNINGLSATIHGFETQGSVTIEGSKHDG